jgi:hypothetical protein
MDPTGKPRPNPNDTYSGNHVNSHPPSSASSLKDEGEHPADMDIEKSEPLDGNNDTEKNDVFPPGQDPSVFPDGGFDAWFAVAGGFCTIFASFGWINCNFLSLGSFPAITSEFQLNRIGIGVFQNYYEMNQLKAYNPSTISWIPSTESFMLFFWVSIFLLSFIIHVSSNSKK